MYIVSRGLVILGDPTHTCSTDVYLPLHQRLSFRCIICPSIAPWVPPNDPPH